MQFLAFLFLSSILKFSNKGDNPHFYVNLIVRLLSHNGLLDLAEKIAKKGIEVNTMENIRKHFGSLTSNLEFQQKLEFGRLYSHYAWILYQKGQHQKAKETIEKAIDYKLQSAKPDSEDFIRLGLICYQNGDKDQGWEHISKALLIDSRIEAKIPSYSIAINEVIQDKIDCTVTPSDFISDFRNQHAEPVPNLSLIPLVDDATKIEDQRGRVLFINFFSPICGSSKQELSNLKPFHDTFLSNRDVALLFVLNRPNCKQEALALFNQNGLSESNIFVIENGSAYSLISMEPTIWIVNKKGKIVARYNGYNPGDEVVYRQELLKAIDQN